MIGGSEIRRGTGFAPLTIPGRSYDTIPEKGAINWSDQQEEIFARALTTRDNLIVNARPGSGKTKTQEELARRIHAARPDWSILGVAFNKSVKNDLERAFRLPHSKHGIAKATTMHQWGLAALHGAYKLAAQPDEFKLWRWTKKICAENRIAYPDWYAIRQMVEFCRLNLTSAHDDQALTEMAKWFSLAYDTAWQGTIIKILTAMYNEVLELGVYDHTDMIYMPVVTGLKPWRHDVVLGDEFQDWNRCQAALLYMMLRPGGKLIVTGDKNQGIYSWAGADYRLQESLVQQFNLQSMPLDITYRCPLSHIALANEVYPGLIGRPDAPEGILEKDFPMEHLNDQGGSKVAMLCRRNSPIFKKAIDMMKRGRAAIIRGAGLGVGMISNVDVVERMSGGDFANYGVGLRRWVDNEIQLAKARHATEGAFNRAHDQGECLGALIAGSNADTWEGVRHYIRKLFQQDRSNALNLLTVHGAKGGQWPTVYVMEANRLGQVTKDNATEIEQIEAQNINYVAKTRSQSAMYLINEPLAQI